MKPRKKRSTIIGKKGHLAVINITLESFLALPALFSNECLMPYVTLHIDRIFMRIVASKKLDSFQEMKLSGASVMTAVKMFPLHFS